MAMGSGNHLLLANFDRLLCIYTFMEGMYVLKQFVSYLCHIKEERFLEKNAVDGRNKHRH